MSNASKAIPLIALAVGAIYIGTRGSGRVLAAGKALGGSSTAAAKPAAGSGASGTLKPGDPGYDPAKDPLHAGGGGNGGSPLDVIKTWFTAPMGADATIGNNPNAFNQDTGLPPIDSSGPNSFNPGYRPEAGGAGTWGQLMPTYQHNASFTGAALYSSEGN